MQLPKRVDFWNSGKTPKPYLGTLRALDAKCCRSGAVATLLGFGLRGLALCNGLPPIAAAAVAVAPGPPAAAVARVMELSRLLGWLLVPAGVSALGVLRSGVSRPAVAPAGAPATAAKGLTRCKGGAAAPAAAAKGLVRCGLGFAAVVLAAKGLNPLKLSSALWLLPCPLAWPLLHASAWPLLYASASPLPIPLPGLAASAAAWRTRRRWVSSAQRHGPAN